MKDSVWFIGALVCAVGVMTILKPEWMKRTADVLLAGWWWRLTAALKAAVGVIFLVFARECRIPGLIITVGILILIGSLAALTVDPAIMNTWLQCVKKWPRWAWRCWGVAAAIVGGLLLYAG